MKTAREIANLIGLPYRTVCEWDRRDRWDRTDDPRACTGQQLIESADKPESGVAMARMSDLQDSILFMLVRLFVAGHRGWVPWEPAKVEGEWSRADSATRSRSLRALERRGLVERWNHATGGNRTTRVCITEQGLRVAIDRAAKMNCPWILEPKYMRESANKVGD
jgi:hypothetical protein